MGKIRHLKAIANLSGRSSALEAMVGPLPFPLPPYRKFQSPEEFSFSSALRANKPAVQGLHGGLAHRPKDLKGIAWSAIREPEFIFKWSHPSDPSLSLRLTALEVLNFEEEKRLHIRDIILMCFYEPLVLKEEYDDEQKYKKATGWDPEYY